MPTITRPHTYTPGTVIVAAQVSLNETTVYDLVNGALDSTNIASLAEGKVTFSGSGHAHAGGTGGAPIQFVNGSAIASAATITIPTDGNTFQVTGSVAITAINSRPVGVFAILRFAAACLLTHNAVSLILQDGYSVAMQAGDVICLGSEGAGNWRELWRMKGARSSAYRSIGLRGANNAVAPNTKFDLAADVVHFRGGTVKTAVSVTNDTGQDNTVANGRDQAGAFASSTWLHFYFVLKSDGTVASRSSTAVHTTGPTLPSGEIDWAYAGAVYYNATPLLVVTLLRGAWAHYTVSQSALADGVATVETAISLSALVPPNASRALLDFSGATANRNFHFRLRSGDGDYLLFKNAVWGSTFGWWFERMVPITGQQIFYLWDTAPAATTGLYLNVQGYQLPNGDA